LAPNAELVPARLSLARQMRGFGKAELADLVSLSPSAITQFESGTARPRRDVTMALAFALRVPTQFLSSSLRVPTPISENDVHFRRLRSSRKRDRQRVLARVALLQELILALEDHIGFPRVDIPEELSIEADQVNWPTRVEDVAGQLRQRWNLGQGPISNVVRLLEAKGCIVTRLRTDVEEIDAFSGWRKTRPFVVLASDKEDAARSRFDAAHELGHLVLHPDADPTDRRLEVQAHAFASCFLMPAASIARELPTSVDIDRLLMLKARWRVSLQALIRRARDVGRLTDSQYRSGMTRLSVRGWRAREPGDAGPIEEPMLVEAAVEQLDREKGLSVRDLASAIGLGTEDTIALYATS
jgi:Zn-dependent peptidase ImmA (M78 family)/transcriptional regulator with XRE-family HTH domain